MFIVYTLACTILIWTLFIFLYQYIAGFGIAKSVLAAFKNPRILMALWLSITSACVTTIIAIIFGVPLAYFFAIKEFRGKVLLATLTIDVPQTFPPIAEGIILLLMLGPQSPFKINIAYTFMALVIAKLYVCAPFVIALSLRRFKEIQESGIDLTAQSLGATPFQVFRTVFIPMAYKDTMAGVALCWARAMGELGGSLIFAGIIPFKTEDIPTFISVMSSDTASALAATMLVTTASILALLFFKVITSGSGLWKALFYKI
jgi:molybdate transport system permease protein